MRNFSAVSQTCFHSYIVNWGEYVSFEETLVVEVVKALSAAFETRYDLVSESFAYALTGVGESQIASSEFRVLEDLVTFLNFVIASLKNDGKDCKTKAFMYNNLNTGRCVTWVHSIC